MSSVRPEQFYSILLCYKYLLKYESINTSRIYDIVLFFSKFYSGYTLLENWLGRTRSKPATLFGHYSASVWERPGPHRQKEDSSDNAFRKSTTNRLLCLFPDQERAVDQISGTKRTYPSQRRNTGKRYSVRSHDSKSKLSFLLYFIINFINSSLYLTYDSK